MKRNMKLMEDVIKLYNKVEDLYTNISNKLNSTHDFDGVYGTDGLYRKFIYISTVRFNISDALRCIENNIIDVQSIKSRLYKIAIRTNDIYRIYKNDETDSDNTSDPLYLYNIVKDIRKDLLDIRGLRVDKTTPSISVSNQECIKIKASLKCINYKNTEELFKYIQELGFIKDFDISVFYIEYDLDDRQDIAISLDIYKESVGDLVKILNTLTRYSYINMYNYNMYRYGWDFEKLGKRIRNKMNISRIPESNINIFHTVEWLFNSVAYGTPDPMEILE